MTAPPAANHAAPWPLFDLFCDLPHPCASKSCPPPFLIHSPSPLDELAKNLLQIARFAFPEETSAPATGDGRINKYDQYAMQNKTFQHFTFTLQMQNGQRVYGHVRRYLPPHLVARSRYDVGRRGERALVILTRASGADTLYASILKSVDAISSQQAVLTPELAPNSEPQKFFLHQLFRFHQHLAQVYASKPVQERGKPLIANLEGIEVGNIPIYKQVDTSRFIFPTCLLHRVPVSDPSATQSSSLLPLLRCVGVPNALRIMAALLSERRVIMVSSSPTRLATSSHAALGMLAQGLLHWQHLYIPVMPPNLWEYLAAPYPYLIGVLTDSLPKLDRTDGLGEVLIIHLDSNQMETRNIEQAHILERLPDLFQNADQTPAGAAVSATELLAQDLLEVLKADKRTLYGESTFPNMGETAAKATQAMRNTFFKLRDKGRQYLNKSKQESSESIPEQEEPGKVEEKSLAPDYVYTEACHNEAAEEEARIAFTSFFLCMFGNMRWYLSGNPGEIPRLDRNRFLQQKRDMGEGEGTAMWPLLQNFCQTQMLEEFAKARVEEIRTRQPITPDASLFVQCTAYHRQHNIDYDVISVRRVARQVAESSPSRVTGQLQTNARKIAMVLTSNKSFEGDYGRAIAQLVEQCRESSSILFDVMSVVWLRLRDSRGMQWKHGYQALQLLKNILYHGPMAAIAEATDGLDKIRNMKFYEHMRPQIQQDVRTAAAIVYNILVDRSKLFHIRRVCIERRRALQNPQQSRLVRDSRLHIISNFRNVHAAMNPTAQHGTVAVIPPAPPTQAQMQRGESADLLGMTPQTISGSEPQQIAISQPAAPGDDLMGLFDNMSFTPSNPATLPGSGAPAPPSVPQQSFAPTVAQLPPQIARPPSGGPLPYQTGAPHAPQFSPTYVQLPPRQGAPPGQVGPPPYHGAPMPHNPNVPPQQQQAFQNHPSPQVQQQQQYVPQQTYPGAPMGATPPPRYQQEQQNYGSPAVPPQGGYPLRQQGPSQAAVHQQMASGPANPPQQRNLSQFDPFS